VRYLKYNLLSYTDGYCNIKIRQLPIPYQVSTVNVAMHRLHKPLSLPVLVKPTGPQIEMR
jgi:hypothetical protein